MKLKKKKMRRRTKKGGKHVKGKKPPEVKKKRPLIGGHKNDQILVGQYRPLLRKDVLERIRQVIEHSMKAAVDIQRLRQARFDSIIDTINAEVDASVAHIDKSMSEIRSTYAQYNNRNLADATEDKAKKYEDMKKIFDLLSAQFDFAVFDRDKEETQNIATDDAASEKRSARSDVEDETEVKGLEGQKATLLQEIEDAEVRVIADEQVLQEQLDEMDGIVTELQKTIDEKKEAAKQKEDVLQQWSDELRQLEEDVNAITIE